MTDGGQCEIGENGCIAAQNIKTELRGVNVQQKVNTSDIVQLWKIVQDIRSLLLKAVVLMTVLTAGIQVAFRLWPQG